MESNCKNELKMFMQVNEELRRFYDHIVNAFEHVRNKALALLVGEVAVVTFLFQDFRINSATSQNPPVYGFAVLGLGLFLLILAYAFFLYVISAIKWRYPTEHYDMKNPTARFNNNPLEYQKYLHSEYMEKIGYCNGKVLIRARALMFGMYALSAGILLVILVKYGGGA